MSCHSRTIGAGIAVLGICIVLMSVTWQYVLAIFSLAGIGWSIWSLAANDERARQARRAERRQRYALSSGPKLALDQPADNIYQFPLGPWAERHEAVE